MRFREIRKPKYLFRCYIVLLLIIKLVLTAGIRVWATTDSPYDDGMMIQNAANLIAGKWLGAFNQYTLAKGVTFPLYTAMLNKLGIPLLLSIVFLCFFACLAFVLAIRKLIPNRFLLALLYTVLMFNPISTYFWTFNRVYRESIYSYLVIFLFSFIIAIFLNRFGSVRRVTLLGVGAGISLAAVWLAREDSPWVMPFVVVALAITAIGICLRKNLQHKAKRLLALAVTPAILIISVWGVSCINNRMYGVFLANEFTGGSLPVLMKELQSIKPDEWSPRTPIPKSTREAAYAVSPTFAKLKPYLENHGFVVLEKGNPTCDLLVWSVVDSVEQSGMTSAQASQLFYQKSAQEIQTAINQGKLKTRGGYTSVFLSPWDNRYIQPLFTSLLTTIKMTVFFEDSNGQPIPASNSVSSGSEIQLRQLEQVTNNLAYYTPADIPKKQGKIDLLNTITSIYKICNPAITIVGLLCYIYLFIQFIRNIRSKKGGLFEPWILLTGLWMSYLLRLALLAYSNVSCNFMLYPMYLAPSYWLILLSSFSSILIAGQDLFTRYHSHQKLHVLTVQTVLTARSETTQYPHRKN